MGSDRHFDHLPATVEDTVTHVRIPVTGLAYAAEDRPTLLASLSEVPGVTRAYLSQGSDTLYLEVDPARFISADAARVLEAYAPGRPRCRTRGAA